MVIGMLEASVAGVVEVGCIADKEVAKDWSTSL